MGPWARSFVAALVGRAERPLDTALVEVRDLTVAVGRIGARVGEGTVTLTAERVPPRIWTAIARFAQGRGPLEEAVAGRTQAVHLEHLMAQDWDEPLVPRASAITRACTCDGADACEHITAFAFAFADEIDADPSVLLRWRGCTEDASDEVAPAPVETTAEPGDAWRGSPLPEAGVVRALPPGAVLERLGASGILVGDEDLGHALRRAYATFSQK